MSGKTATIIILVIIILAGIYYFLTHNQSKPLPLSNISVNATPTAQVTSTPTPTNAPSPTPSAASVNLTAQTLSVEGVLAERATLRGRIVPNGLTTSYWFEYGTTPQLGSKTTISSVVSTQKTQDVVKTVTLKPETRYYFRLVGENSAGTFKGEVLSFSTPAK